MLPMKDLRLSIGTLISEDATFLAPVAANKLVLIKEAFTPSENLVLGSLTLADFTGSTPIAGVAGNQQTGIDPATGDQIVTIRPPVGGYRWITADAVNLPQTIFGYALVNNAASVLLAVETLPTPLTLQGAGEEISLGPIQMTIVQEPIS